MLRIALFRVNLLISVVVVGRMIVSGWSGAFTSDWHSIDHNVQAKSINGAIELLPLPGQLNHWKQSYILRWSVSHAENNTPRDFSQWNADTFRIWCNLHHCWGGRSLSLSFMGIAFLIHVVALTVVLVVVISAQQRRVLNAKSIIRAHQNNQQQNEQKGAYSACTTKENERKCTKIAILSLFRWSGDGKHSNSYACALHGTYEKHTQHLCAWSPRSRSRSMSIVRLMSAAHISHVHNLQFIHRYAL